MLLMLMTGIGLGAVIFRNTPGTSAAADRPQLPANPASITVSPPAQDNVNRLAPAQEADAAQYLAVIFARQSADIVARSDGRLEAVYVNLGDRLQAGDVIASTESRSISQQLQMAEASLVSARAEERNGEVELKNAQSRYQRRQELWESGLISTEDLATAKVQVQSSEAKLEMTQARVAEQIARIEDTRASVANTVVTAGFAGTVAARYVDAGATVRSGTPIISLIRSDDLWIRFAVPEGQHAVMGIGSAIKFQADGLKAVIPGVIEYVSPAVMAMSQEFLAEARLKVPAPLLEQIRPGARGVVGK